MVRGSGRDAGSAGCARQGLGHRPFDVAMLDMNLDGDRPFAIADALTARGVPFLFATGYDGRDLKGGYGDRPVLNKPFQAHELRKALAGLLSPPAG